MYPIHLDKKPFFADSSIQCYKGQFEHSSVTVKKIDCTRAALPDTVTEMNIRINEGLAQFRLDYQYVAKLLEVRVDITQSSFAVLHVLESLDKNVTADIEERKRFSRRYTEAELRTFLYETSRALAFAHTKEIAHGDFTPASVFLSADGVHKVTNFGCVTRLPVFKTPQLRRLQPGVLPNSFKADVFALAMSGMNLALLAPPTTILTAEDTDAAVFTEVASLPFSEDLKSLLRDMMTANEEARIGINEVVDRLTTASVQTHLGKPKLKLQLRPPLDEASPLTGRTASFTLSPGTSPMAGRTTSFTVSPGASPVPQSNPMLAFMTKKQVRRFNFEMSGWGPFSNLERSIECYSDSVYTMLDPEKVFCCGGFGSGNTSYLVHVTPEHSRVQVLPDMNEGRGLPGIVPYKEAMYVFAGKTLRNEHLRTGEIIDLSMPNMWVRLSGEMREGRHAFNACVFRNKVYLSMGIGARSIELFDLLKSRFLDAGDFVLPEAEGCATWIHAGQMTIISRKYMTKIDFRQTNPVMQSQTHPDLEVCPNTHPAVSGHSVFWIQGDSFVRATMNRTVILLEKFRVDG